MRIIEWFSGIGGCRAAAQGHADVVCAVDTDEGAADVYQRWWGEPTRRWNIASVRAHKLPAADLWWMSPPCQPYSVRGAQRDLADRRSAAFVQVVSLLREALPSRVALENVPGFAGSQGHHLLTGALADHGYHVTEGTLSPTRHGVPQTRHRFFLLADRHAKPTWPAPGAALSPLSAYVDPTPPPETTIDAATLDRFRGALHVVDADDALAITACFTGAYGRSPVYAGSYLRQGGALRRFSPDEIVRLMGFPAHCHLPETLSLKKRYKLAGNSVSVDCARALLAPWLAEQDSPTTPTPRESGRARGGA